MKKFSIFCILSLWLIFGSDHKAFAISVLSDYTYTGSTGDYLLNFSFTNNIPGEYNQHIDVVAVELPYDPLVGWPVSPFYWVPAPEGAVLNNASQGGSDVNYLNYWVAAWGLDINTNILTPINDIPSGQSLSGFSVHVDQIPGIIHFAAFTNDYLCSQCGSGVISNGPGYFGDDAFLKGHVAGFEGLATGPPGVVPEPASLSLLSLGLSGLLLRRKRIDWSI